MLTKNGKRIESEDGGLVAVLTNTERKAQRIRERHGIPAFVGLDLTVEDVEARLAGTPVALDPKSSDATPADSLDGKSRAELDEIASGLGIDLGQIDGTGKNGNVVAADVRAAIEEAKEAADADAPDEPVMSDPAENTGIYD